MNKHISSVKVFATIEGSALLAVMKPLVFVTGRSSTMPILQTVKLSLDGTVLSAETTDLDISIRGVVDVIDCAGTWAITVNARLLAEIARVAGPMTMRIEPQGEELTIDLDGGVVTYRLPTFLTKESFPSWPTGDRGNLIEAFTNGFLPSALAKCRVAISNEETRYYLNGVCWASDSVGRWFCSTNGHHLIKYSYGSPGEGGKFQRIIPKKLVDLIVQHFAGADVRVFDVTDKPRIDLDIGQFSIRTKLIEGTFPDVDRVIPKREANPIRIVVAKEGLLSAIRRVGMISTMGGRGLFNGVALRFSRSDHAICVGAKSQYFGMAEAVLDAEWPEDGCEFGVSRRYLLDQLSTCSGKTTLAIRDAGAPILILDDDDAITRVLMPMRV